MGGLALRTPCLCRSKQHSTETIRLVNLMTKRDSVVMAFPSGVVPEQTPFLARERRFYSCVLVAALPHQVVIEDTTDHFNSRAPDSQQFREFAVRSRQSQSPG